MQIIQKTTKNQKLMKDTVKSWNNNTTANRNEYMRDKREPSEWPRSQIMQTHEYVNHKKKKNIRKLC